MERKISSRQLAAILFTDIVGYTTMMQRDESIALAAVRRHHEVLENTIPAHDGEIYQYYGDGSLSIFHSATQAVQCAYEIQKQMLQEPLVYVRTGIHIGEIYREGGKIFGDGVNIASRIESIGQGGAVLFSKDVYEKVRNHTSFQIRSIGTFEFKNVDDPIEVYALWNSEIVQPDLSLIEGKLKREVKKSKRSMLLKVAALLCGLIATGFLLNNSSNLISNNEWESEKSVAVLPFKNYSEQNKEDFLSTGIAEDILNQLAQIDELKVIAQSSSMKYKGTDKDLMTIAKELDVTSLLDGSVQNHDNHLRITVRLIKASDESIIWSKSFDGEFEDILNVQRNIALEVSQNMKVRLSSRMKERFEDRVNVDPEAYVNCQKGEELLKRSSGSYEDMAKARQYFEMSLQEDPTFTQAWVGLADAWIETIFWHRVADEDALPQAREAAKKAMALDPENGDCYGVLGAVHLLDGDLISAEKYLRRSIDWNPNYSFAYERLAWLALFKGDKNECFALYDKVLKLDPLSTRYKGSMGSVYYFSGEFQQGIDRMKEFLRLDPMDNFILWALAYCYAGNKEYEKAIETLDKRTLGKNTNWIYTYCYAKLGKMEEAKKIIAHHLENKKTKHVPDFMMAIQYISIGDNETGLDYLEKSIETKGENWFILGFKKDPMLDPVREYPRFKKIMKRLDELYTF